MITQSNETREIEDVIPMGGFILTKEMADRIKSGLPYGADNNKDYTVNVVHTVDGYALRLVVNTEGKICAI